MMIHESHRLTMADHNTILGPGRPAMTDNSTTQDDRVADAPNGVGWFHVHEVWLESV